MSELTGVTLKKVLWDESCLGYETNVRIADSIDKEVFKSLSIGVCEPLPKGTEMFLHYCEDGKDVLITLGFTNSDNEDEWFQYKTSDLAVQLSIDTGKNYAGAYREELRHNPDLRLEDFVEREKRAAEYA